MTDRAALVRALRDLQGVADAEVVDDGAGVGTLRLSLDTGADEVQVAIAVNGVLRDGFGLGVDAGRVQVIEESWPAPASTNGQLVAETPPPPVSMVASAPEHAHDLEAAGAVVPTATPMRSERIAQAELVGRAGRATIRRLQMVAGGVSVSAAVTLGLGADTFVGSADGDALPEAVQRSVAVATARALQELLGDLAIVTIERASVVEVAGDHIAVVVVSLSTTYGEQRLTGASVVRDDARQAVIRATLDAVNRRVEALLTAARS